MAADGCIFHRTLSRCRTGPNTAVVCREPLTVVDVRRYTRDQSSPVYFPHAVLSGDSLYDVTLTDGHCRLQVTLDPGLNRLVERHLLRAGTQVGGATFSPALSAQLPESPAASGDLDSYRLQSVDLREDAVSVATDAGWDALPWFGSSGPPGPPAPLRAHRSVFLPLWNNVDYSGEAWEEEEQEEEEQEEEDYGPSVTVATLRQSFLSGRRGVASGAVSRRLVVRIISKSHLMYYGRPDRNCTCPYKALLQVRDPSGGVCVVLWNSVCVEWFRRLEPGALLSITHFRVKGHYQNQADDIEISVNSRNPAARLQLLPEASVPPPHRSPPPGYSFLSSKELLDRPDGVICDVIGLVTFVGRSERIRSNEGRGAELLQYRWLRLEDGCSEHPIMVKLFCTSQPETQQKLHPLSVVVCSHLRLQPGARPAHRHLTNTPPTQVYCSGHHSQGGYRKLRRVRLFLQWLRRQDEARVLSRALIGGFFLFPPPPTSLSGLMKERRGELGLLGGAELQGELDRLCYREQRSFCIQAAVAMVAFSRPGEEDACLFWMDRSCSSPPSPLRPPPSPPSSLRPPPLPPQTPPLPLPLLLLPGLPELRPLTASPGCGPSSRLCVCRAERRRKLPPPATPSKRRPLVTLQPESPKKTEILFQASLEFLGGADEDSDEDSDGDAASYRTAPPAPPAFAPVAMETLPMRHDHARRREQAAAAGMGGPAPAGGPDCALREYYVLRLRALADGVLLDAVFLPHAPAGPPPDPHPNTWASILAHGAFSAHTPAPAPGDLVATAAQLANQRLVCVLEACHLGGARTELVLSRAFPLSG